MDISSALKAVLILDLDGKRILGRTFDAKTSVEQFERKIFVKSKSQKTKDDILVVDGMLVLHKFSDDLHLYVVGNKNDNPLILDSVLNCLAETITSFLNKNPARQSSIKDHMSQAILALDEICDNGIVLETDSNLVIQRVCLKEDIVEPSMAQKLQSASEYVRFSWIRS